MEKLEQMITYDTKTLNNVLHSLPFSPEQVCFFDIETTGLSPQVSSLYLIGAAWYDERNFRLTQWFADDYVSEKEILEAFSTFVQDFSVFIHYNGSTFDIPYLEKKYLFHKLPSPFEGRESFDLFKEIRRQKIWFSTSDKKLTSMEQLLSFRRSDQYTGKDCIRLYTEFMQKKFFKDNKAETRKNQLLLHNHDDLIGTILCCQFLYYTRYYGTSPACERTDNFLLICDSISGFFPIPWDKKVDDVSFHFKENLLTMEIPLFHGTLYHYYKDYKNYYYLPEEDMAVHKSVGIYVDSSRRVKAGAANCYTKKTGTFLPLPGKLTIESVPLFQESRKSPVSYLYLDQEKFSISSDMLTELLNAYLKG
jgi:hypothetical protein